MIISLPREIFCKMAGFKIPLQREILYPLKNSISREDFLGNVRIEFIATKKISFTKKSEAF